MSFQAGIWNYDGKPVDKDFLLNLSSGAAPYAPGRGGEYWSQCIGLVARQFHTTMESRLEDQPYVSASGKILTWDGRLDNRDELMQLTGGQDRVVSDLELVAAAFDCWGKECFAKLLGDWAVTVWDPATKTLTLARDYMGIRHLFYYPKRSSLLWASHLESLATCGDRFTLCEE